MNKFEGREKPKFKILTLAICFPDKPVLYMHGEVWDSGLCHQTEKLVSKDQNHKKTHT